MIELDDISKQFAANLTGKALTEATKEFNKHFTITKHCEWKEVYKNDCIYKPECQDIFGVNHGVLSQTKFKYCPYCGGLIVIIGK